MSSCIPSASKHAINENHYPVVKKHRYGGGPVVEADGWGIKPRFSGEVVVEASVGLGRELER